MHLRHDRGTAKRAAPMAARTSARLSTDTVPDTP